MARSPTVYALGFNTLEANFPEPLQEDGENGTKTGRSAIPNRPERIFP